MKKKQSPEARSFKMIFRAITLHHRWQQLTLDGDMVLRRRKEAPTQTRLLSADRSTALYQTEAYSSVMRCQDPIVCRCEQIEHIT